MLSQEFVEKRISMLKHPTTTWELGGGAYYQLDLHMCSLPKLQYAFMWGTDSQTRPKATSLVDQPHRIVLLNLSLNDLDALGHEGLAAFRNLRELDVSLNRIQTISGVEVLRNLYTLNLSHNFLKSLGGLDGCFSLVELNLSHNELTDISFMPALSKLKVFNVSNNKLRSIDGVQGLSRLRELHCQRNFIEDVVPASSCLQLTVINASENRISSLHSVCSVIEGLKLLQVLHLHGNPVETDPHYQSHILRAAKLNMLDNVTVRPELRRHQYADKTAEASNISKIKEMAKQAFLDQLNGEKDKVGTEVRFLQQRILTLQKEFSDYEKQMMKDLENCMRYMDTLRIDDVRSYNLDYMRELVGTPIPKPWHRPPPEDLPARPGGIKGDFGGVKDTENVLRLAARELAHEQLGQTGRQSKW